jgi:hypothetical protein
LVYESKMGEIGQMGHGMEGKTVWRAISEVT